MSDAKAEILKKNLFDHAFYLDQALARNVQTIWDYPSLLDHYIGPGWKEGLDPSPLFPVAAYLHANPDIREAGVEPLSHYVTQGWREKRRLGRDHDRSAPRAVAFYLPQFHPDPQNESWWGKGFTEWTNVSRARPFFSDHRQPILPGDLGFYDLRLAQVREEQARLAQANGIDGFCYYYYWFNGRKVLDLPLNEVLEQGQPRFPFCLCWANENWTRRWDGREAEILLEQEHTPLNDYAFIYDILPALADDRYIRVDGRPLLLVYRPDLMAEPAKTAQLWREVAVQSGLPGLHLGAVNFTATDPRPLGFDCLIEFPPHHFRATEITVAERRRLGAPDTMTIKRYSHGVSWSLAGGRGEAPFPIFPGVMPSWDNTARRMESATVYHGSTPALFELWLTAQMLRAAHELPAGRRLVFVNAWNEWAEGAILEPRRDVGHAYLAAAGRAKSAVERHLSGQGDGPFIELADWIAEIDRCISERKTPAIAIAHDAQRAGAQILLARLLKSIRAAADNVEIFVVSEGDGPLLDEYGPAKRVFRSFRLGTQGLKADERADLLLSVLETRIRLPILCNTAVMAHYCKAAADRGLRSILYLHELPTSIDMYVGDKPFLEAARHSGQIITVSNYTKTTLSHAYPELADKIEVIYAGVPERDNFEARETGGRLRESWGFNAQDPIILGCGAIHPRKGVDFLPAIAAHVVKKLGSNVRFVWCGGVQSDPNYLRWIEHDLHARGLERNVIFAGHIDEVSSLYGIVQAVILPSREDPFPLVALEAAQAGAPVVVFADAGGAQEVVEGLDELKAPYGDVEAMADRVIAILKNRESRGYLGRTLERRMSENFTWTGYVGALSALWLGTGDTGKRAKAPAFTGRGRPRVSVVVPFYNHGRFIEETLASVAAQTYPADEIIVIDDGSRREDRERAAAEAARHPNARFESRPNRGAHHTINECIEKARGDLVSILNSDDLYHPNRLEQLVSAAETRPNAGMFASEVTFINEEGQRFDGGPWYHGGLRLIDEGTPVWLALLERNFLMTTSNFCFRRPFLQEIGPFRDFRYAHDLDMLERVLLRSDIGLLRSELLSYRFHGANTIRKDMLGIRTEIAQIAAECYSTRLANGRNDPTIAATVGKLLREQVLLEAYDVFIRDIAKSTESSGSYLCCSESARATGRRALEKRDKGLRQRSSQAEKGGLAALTYVSEDGGSMPEAALALAAYDRLEHKEEAA